MQQISPSLLVLINVATTGAMLIFFQRQGLSEQNFTLSLLALAGAYGLLNLVRQFRGQGQYQVLRHICWPRLARQVAARYLVWLGVIGSGWLFFHLQPYYGGEAFRVNRILFGQLLDYYLILGVPYFTITLLVRHNRREDFYDPVVRLILMVKQLSMAPGLKTLRRLLRRRYNLKVLLNLFMRVYFIPIMIIQVYANIYWSLQLVQNQFQHHDYLTFMTWLAYFLFLMDVTNAATNYLLESRWLENRTQSIDLTVGGWLVCCMCYAPLNLITGSEFPFAPMVVSNVAADLVINNVMFLYVIKTVEVLLLIFHVSTNLSLGASVVNITLKKLQTRGPYGLVRHPGTTTKLLYWLVQSVFYRSFWQWKFIYGYIGWAVIYYLRTVTEERHLKHFAVYREYMKKVKYRFFPGWF